MLDAYARLAIQIPRKVGGQYQHQVVGVLLSPEPLVVEEITYTLMDAGCVLHPLSIAQNKSELDAMSSIQVLFELNNPESWEMILKASPVRHRMIFQDFMGVDPKKYEIR